MTDAKVRISQLYKTRPLIFGHRGASAYAPMNTLPAFRLAYEMGADGIELDVHRTRDNEIVIVHDFSVDGSTNGSGRVQDMTLSELKALDAGSWFEPRFAGVQIPTLDETFDAVGDKLILNIEIKSMPGQDDGLERLLAAKVWEYAMQDRVIVSSFNPTALIRFREAAPQIAIGMLSFPGSPFSSAISSAGLDFEAVHPYVDEVNRALISDAHGNGQRVNTWTVNDPDVAKSLWEMDIDGIITDKPDIIRSAIETRRA